MFVFYKNKRFPYFPKKSGGKSTENGENEVRKNFFAGGRNAETSLLNKKTVGVTDR